MTKIYEFTLDEIQINHIKEALLGGRYAAASMAEDDEKKRTDEALEDAEIGHMVVDDLDKLIELFTQLDNRINQNEKFYLRCCVVPIQETTE